MLLDVRSNDLAPKRCGLGSAQEGECVQGVHVGWI
jgi:hypothetical protein